MKALPPVSGVRQRHENGLGVPNSEYNQRRHVERSAFRSCRLLVTQHSPADRLLPTDMVWFGFYLFQFKYSWLHLLKASSYVTHCFLSALGFFGFSCWCCFLYMRFWNCGLCWPNKDVYSSHMLCCLMSHFVCLGYQY